MRLLAIDPDLFLSPRILWALNQEGFIVDRTKEIKKGVWMAKTNLYEIIFLLIPDRQTLIDVFKKINGEQPGAFIIALVGPSSTDTRVVLLEMGLDEALYYPCPFRELVAKMRSMLRRVKSVGEPPLCERFDDLTIDPANFSVKRGETEIFLRRKEFDLLLYLFRNAGKVVTKTNILEGVWDANADLFTNTLEVHVLNLRRKIDSGYPPERKLIHTVYGRGYLFGLRPLMSGVTPATAPVSSN